MCYITFPIIHIVAASAPPHHDGGCQLGVQYKWWLVHHPSLVAHCSPTAAVMAEAFTIEKKRVDAKDGESEDG
jgi:hypothetical protein